MTDERRFPRSVYSRGEDPDPRFSLANERTFLTWIGTSLALISVGVGLESLATNLQPGFRTAASIVLIVAGLVCPVQAWRGWAGVETALRERRPLPPSGMLVVLPAALVVAGVLVLLGFLVP